VVICCSDAGHCVAVAAAILIALPVTYCHSVAVFISLVYQDAQQLHDQLRAVQSGATWLSTMHIEVHVLPDQQDGQHASLGGQCITIYLDIPTNLLVVRMQAGDCCQWGGIPASRSSARYCAAPVAGDPVHSHHGQRSHEKHSSIPQSPAGLPHVYLQNVLTQPSLLPSALTLELVSLPASLLLKQPLLSWELQSQCMRAFEHPL